MIARCYWPLLALRRALRPHRHRGHGLHAGRNRQRAIPPGSPSFARLIGTGRVELDRLGLRPDHRAAGSRARRRRESCAWAICAYGSLLGARPQLALVNEQAWSGGLVAHYLDAGYRALLMDWDNPAAHHPEWPAESALSRRRARAAPTAATSRFCGPTRSRSRSCSVSRTTTSRWTIIWHFVARPARRDARARCASMPATPRFSIFVPGRYPHRGAVARTSRNGHALGSAFAALADARRLPPDRAVGRRLTLAADTDEPLRLETAAYPVPVKKQRKYNLSRWAVTGRDDIAINAACQRIYRALRAAQCRRTRIGKRFAVSGPAISAPTSPTRAGRDIAPSFAANAEARHDCAATPRPRRSLDRLAPVEDRFIEIEDRRR